MIDVMIAYHELTPKAVKSVLQEGLKRTSRGQKGDDSLIAKTDKLLDARRPTELRRADISRDDNLYAYVVHKNKVIDITDGSFVSCTEFIERSKQAVLELQVDPVKCLVSDLDIYDRLKKIVEYGENSDAVIDIYWQALVPLINFVPGDIRRPEIMVPYNVVPSDIKVIKSG